MTRTITRSVIGLLAAITVMSSCGEDRELAGYVRDPAPAVDAVAIPDLSQGGTEFTLSANDGELLVVYFGYTNCPDVCPTTLADYRQAKRKLSDDDRAKVDLAMVTIDPERDIPVLSDYVQSFDDEAHTLGTDDQAALLSVAEPFGVSYQVVTNDAGEIEVGHSSQLFVVNDQGELVLTWQFGTTADDIAADLEQLLKGQTA